MSLRRIQFSPQVIQGRRLDRLDQVFVKTSFLRALPILLLTPACQSDEENLLASRLLSDATAGFVAVQFRQADV